MVLAETLSQVHIPEIEPDANHMEDKIEYQAYSVLYRMPVTMDKMEKIREETSKDPTMRILRNVIHRGWPETRRQTLADIHKFWNY